MGGLRGIPLLWTNKRYFVHNGEQFDAWSHHESTSAGSPGYSLHAFIKKTQQTPDSELKLARKRVKDDTSLDYLLLPLPGLAKPCPFFR